MSLKSTSRKAHTGFAAHLKSGRTVYEKDNYLDSKTGAKRATNWGEVPLSELASLELQWQGVSKISLDVGQLAGANPKESWYFTCSGVIDAASPNAPRVVERNIGFSKDGTLYLFSVNENDGALRIHARPAKG